MTSRNLVKKTLIRDYCEIARQNLLPSGTTTEIEEAVINFHNKLYQNGGIIAQCEFGPAARPENVMKVFETWDFGTRRLNTKLQTDEKNCHIW